MPPNEAFSRVEIDGLLEDAAWNLTDGRSVRYEYWLSDGTRADYVLCDRHGRPMAVIEAKRSTLSPADAAAQGRAYAEQLVVPFVFLSNGKEIRLWDFRTEAHPRPVKTFFKQDDLERRIAVQRLRVDPLTVPVDQRIVERDYQLECIDTLCREINRGRRKLLVDMATGTGKTRTAAALIKRLFQANAISRVLFLVEPGLLVRLLRSCHFRRMPPQHLRQVEGRAAALRGRSDRPHCDAVRHG